MLQKFCQSLFNPDADEIFLNRRLLPARQLDFNDPLAASIFKEIHYLGNWVVNFDELLDRRQLLNQGVQVIRYKQGVTQGSNILISSTAPLSLLRLMVFKHKLVNLDSTVIDLCATLFDWVIRIIVTRCLKRTVHISSRLC